MNVPQPSHYLYPALWADCKSSPTPATQRPPTVLCCGNEVCYDLAKSPPGQTLKELDVKMIAKGTPPENWPALVLNADYRPLSYYPLSLWNWQATVKAVFLDRVNIVDSYDRKVHSPSFEIQLPSVVALKTYVRPALYPAFTRFNVFLRDRFSCQYCGDLDDLTFDHLIPRSKGGRTRWDNVVTACSPCNLKKGARNARDIGMLPMQAPYRPTVYELHRNGRSFPPNFLHQSWIDYLYWDTELEE